MIVIVIEIETDIEAVVVVVVVIVEEMIVIDTIVVVVVVHGREVPVDIKPEQIEVCQYL